MHLGGYAFAEFDPGALHLIVELEPHPLHITETLDLNIRIWTKE